MNTYEVEVEDTVSGESWTEVVQNETENAAEISVREEYDGDDAIVVTNVIVVE